MIRLLAAFSGLFRETISLVDNCKSYAVPKLFTNNSIGLNGLSPDDQEAA